MTARRVSWVRGLTFVVAAAVAACDAQPNGGAVIPGSGDAGPPDACVALGGCCPSLPSDVVSSCESLGGQASGGQCASLLEALRTDRHCLIADGGVSADAGKDHSDARADGAAADAGPAVACTILDTCCMSPALPMGEAATCTSIQGEGEESLCAPLLASLTSSQSCGPTNVNGGGACPDLEACCETQTFPAIFSTSCLATWNSGDDSACRDKLTTFAAAGYCGTLVDPNCTMLAMCCNEASFPMEELSTCQAIVAGNEGGNCQSAYDAYCGVASSP